MSWMIKKDGKVMDSEDCADQDLEERKCYYNSDIGSRMRPDCTERRCPFAVKRED